MSEDQNKIEPESTEVAETVETGETVETVETVEPDTQTSEPEDDPVIHSEPSAPRRSRLTLLTAAALLVSAVLAGSVYWFVFRTDRLTDQSRQEEALDAAKTGTVALLTYSPDTVDKNLADAKSRLTGDFLQHYSEFADQTVLPAAKQRGVKTEATVARAAVSQMQPGSAQVLVFVNQVTTSRERPTPALATSSVIVTLVKRDGHWLISDFKPV